MIIDFIEKMLLRKSKNNIGRNSKKFLYHGRILSQWMIGMFHLIVVLKFVSKQDNNEPAPQELKTVFIAIWVN